MKVYKTNQGLNPKEITNNQSQLNAEHTRTNIILSPSPLKLLQNNTNINFEFTELGNTPLKNPLSSTLTIYNTASTDQLTSTHDKNKIDGWGCRHVFAFMGFLGMACAFMLRVNLPVAIVAMVKNKQNLSFVNDTSGQFCSFDPVYATNFSDEGEFDWDSPTQGMILGSFFWGYMVTQIPAGVWARKYGGKTLFGWGVLLTAVLTIITPVAARIHVGLPIAISVMGVTFPAMQDLLSRWVPPSERSTFVSFVFGGQQFGIVVAMPISGTLAAIPFDNGWPFAFYVPGALALLWCLAWFLVVFDSPSSHLRITDKEKEYILSVLPHVKVEKIGETPWKAIFGSFRVWAIIVAHVGHSWVFFMLMTELPLYMKSTLHFDLKSNSTLSAIPYLAMWICSNIASWFADYLRSRRKISTTVIRKSFNSFGFLMAGFLLIGAGYSGCNCNRALSITLLTLCMGAIGVYYSGFQVNHLDIASNYAGILMGITNTAGTFSGFLAPFIVSHITTEGKLTEWRLVFYISAAVYLITNLFFVVFATGEEQAWNRSDSDNAKEI